MQKDKEKDDLHAYRVGRLTILELMTFLAVLGILLAWVCQHFFTS